MATHDIESNPLPHESDDEVRLDENHEIVPLLGSENTPLVLSEHRTKVFLEGLSTFVDHSRKNTPRVEEEGEDEGDLDADSDSDSSEGEDDDCSNSQVASTEECAL